MRSIATRRAIVVGSLLVAIGAGSAGMAGQADAATSSPSLSKAKARAHVYKQVRRMASPTKHRGDANGYVGSFAVVQPGKCEKVATSRVQCAWGMLWPNGHQESGLMEVTAKKQGRKTVLTTRNVGETAQGDSGPTGEAGVRGGAFDPDAMGGDAFLPLDNSRAFDPFGPAGTDPGFLAPPTRPPAVTAPAAPAETATGNGDGDGEEGDEGEDLGGYDGDDDEEPVDEA
jgi:hypothetical protein